MWRVFVVEPLLDDLVDFFGIDVAAVEHEFHQANAGHLFGFVGICQFDHVLVVSDEENIKHESGGDDSHVNR